MEDLKQIGKYELREYLGGGMSHVYKARDPVMNRTVVVKIMTRESSSDADASARFLSEAQTAGALSHDNIIRVYDYGEEEGRPYMVMEYLEGQDLREAMKSGSAGDVRRRLEIARESAKALEYIHAQAIVHRDIKPENIHVDRAGRVRLMDFGIAKRPELSLTRTGFTLGTPYYMPPEQVRGENVTHTADIYAYGILLYELFTGIRPFEAGKIEQLFYKIMNDPVDLGPLRAAGLPESVCELIGRCTAKSAADRPQSLAEAIPVFDAALGQPARQPVAPSPTRTLPATPTPQPSAPEPPSRFDVKWILVAAAAVAVLAVAGYFAFRPSAPATPEPMAGVSEPVLTGTIVTPQGEMVLIPGGEFLFGPDRTPASLPPYYIDKTEVTNAAWSAYCADQGKDLPPDFPANRPELPVVNITFNEAQDFARWAGKRLPTPQEWEKAARGADGRAYPWGAEPDPTRANVANNPVQETPELLPAESFSFGASPYQVLQMAGNVYEFVDESVTPSAGALEYFATSLSPKATAEERWCGIRGGSYSVPLVENVTSEQGSVPARYRQVDIGFRCVQPAN